LILTIWRGISPLLARPNITTNYAAEFNAEIERISEHDRAWPLYVEAFRQHVFWPDVTDSEFADLATLPWERVSELDSWLEANRESLALARRAAARPRLGLALSDVQAPAMRQIDFEQFGRMIDPPSEPGE